MLSTRRYGPNDGGLCPQYSFSHSVGGFVRLRIAFSQSDASEGLTLFCGLDKKRASERTIASP
jgi:hypothetical protein